MSAAAEKAWAAHEVAIYRNSAAFGPRYPFVVGYDAGRGSRDAEVESLIVQLQAAQATITEALSYFGDGETAYIAKVLRRADTSALAEVKAKTLDGFAALLRDRYPEDVFPTPSRNDYTKLNFALKGVGVTLDRMSADLIRRAGAQAEREATEIRADPITQ